MIAKEMIRIDVDLFDDAAQAELNHTPIISRGATTSRFPAIHPFALVRVFVRNENSATRLEEIFFFGEKLIVGDEHFSTEPLGSEINQTRRRGILTPGCPRRRA